jgi:hypothetical protein
MRADARPQAQKTGGVAKYTYPPQALSHPPVPASAKTDAFAHGRAPSEGLR